MASRTKKENAFLKFISYSIALDFIYNRILQEDLEQYGNEIRDAIMGQVIEFDEDEPINF